MPCWECPGTGQLNANKYRGLQVCSEMEGMIRWAIFLSKGAHEWKIWLPRMRGASCYSRSGNIILTPREMKYKLETVETFYWIEPWSLTALSAISCFWDTPSVTGDGPRFPRSRTGLFNSISNTLINTIIWNSPPTIPETTVSIDYHCFLILNLPVSMRKFSARGGSFFWRNGYWFLWERAFPIELDQ